MELSLQGSGSTGEERLCTGTDKVSMKNSLAVTADVRFVQPAERIRQGRKKPESLVMVFL